MYQLINLFLWVFIIVFPKGGFKLYDIPITWGYLILGVSGLIAIFRKKWIQHAPRYEILLCLAPFQIVTMISILFNGVASIGMSISFFVSFFIIPWWMLFIFSSDIETMPLSTVYLYLKRGVRFVSLYGVIFFTIKHFVGTFLEVPLLTTNWDDFGYLEELKCINRGFVFKLISTYNNGNIFGICILMLLPLYCFVEKSMLWRGLTKLALILTFSRTVWFGLFFHEFCYFIFLSKGKTLNLFRWTVSFACLSLILAAFGYFYGFGLQFLFDPSLGNRIEQLYFSEISFLSREPFAGIQEIVYFGILRSFGVLGLITFILFILGIFILTARSRRSFLDPSRYIGQGLLNYLFVAFSDGALLYIPVMAIFWFLVSFLARKNDELNESIRPI